MFRRGVQPGHTFLVRKEGHLHGMGMGRDPMRPVIHQRASAKHPFIFPDVAGVRRRRGHFQRRGIGAIRAQLVEPGDEVEAAAGHGEVHERDARAQPLKDEPDELEEP